MAFPDVHEDAATFAAEALLKLIKDYNINPKEISRIYLGTESAVDAAKPTATYAMQMVKFALAMNSEREVSKLRCSRYDFRMCRCCRCYAQLFRFCESKS